MNFFTRRSRNLFALDFLLLAPCLVLASVDEVRIYAPLIARGLNGISAQGSARFRSVPAERRARFSVEVNRLPLPAGTTLDVTVDGANAGSITLSAAPIRGGQLDLNTKQGDRVPAVKAGSVVVVSNGGAAILSGILR